MSVPVSNSRIASKYFAFEDAWSAFQYLGGFLKEVVVFTTTDLGRSVSALNDPWKDLKNVVRRKFPSICQTRPSSTGPQ